MLKRLLSENIFQIATELRNGEIRKRLRAAKHYIVYPETTQGKKDLDNNMRQRTRAGIGSHRQMGRAGNPSLNSIKLHEIDNSKKKTTKTKTLKRKLLRGSQALNQGVFTQKKGVCKKICWPWIRATAKDKIMKKLKKHSFQKTQERWRKERIGR